MAGAPTADGGIQFYTYWHTPYDIAKDGTAWRGSISVAEGPRLDVYIYCRPRSRHPDGLYEWQIGEPLGMQGWAQDWVSARDHILRAVQDSGARPWGSAAEE